MAGTDWFLLRVPDEVVSLLRSLHPEIRSNIRAAIKILLADPAVGKALKDELDGLWSMRVKRFRIIYRVLEDERIIELVAVGPRHNIYEETFRIIGSLSCLQNEMRDWLGETNTISNS